MRNPNGYGSVTKLSGKRRNPYMVKKTVGWNLKGHPIYEVIGYYPTRKEAMLKLAEYNTNPYDLKNDKITVSEVYHKLLELKGDKLGNSTLIQFKAIHNNHIEEIKNIPYKELRTYHIEGCISKCNGGSSSKSNIKKLFTHLDKLALEIDLIDKSYSHLVNVKVEPSKNKKKLFTKDEIAKIKTLPDHIVKDYCLILLYTGLRISELLEIKKENIFLDEGYFIAGKKTASGINRTIPIHKFILPIFERYYQIEKTKPFYIKQDSFSIKWKNYFQKHNLNHTRHECRHTFRSRLDSLGANRNCINKIMGHKSGNTGDDIYTHKSIEELKATIELLDY